ncbi:MAG: hypothetical protein LUQ47_03605 [Methanotrichaceae archaeon]|nr:hypothetical protein [Methanotrichaceae archaeon]
MPENQKNREKFEQEYREWILLMARNAADRMATMSQARRISIMKSYRDFRDPRLVFDKIVDVERIMRLASDRISKYIIIETKAVPFYHSIYSIVPGTLDFAVAMNRRLFIRRLWLPVIALNSEYIRQSDDRILTFTLEHELEMSRIFHEISSNLRNISRDEKREITEKAMGTSIDKLKISQEDLFEDEKLMNKLSFSQPLIPKPYAEMAMLIFLENNIAELEHYGSPSRNSEEETFGENLYKEFQEWSDFTQSTYDLFVREIIAHLIDEYRGYS